MCAMCYIDDNKVKISSLGGIEVILTAMKEHQSRMQIQEEGFYALIDLSENGRERRRRECVCEFLCDCLYCIYL